MHSDPDTWNPPQPSLTPTPPSEGEEAEEEESEEDKGVPARSDDGHESFCRLCGDGHDCILAYMCDYPGCRFIFCPSCIRANGGEPLLRCIEAEVEWICFNHPTARCRLLPEVDLECRAERGQFFDRNAFDCFNTLQQRPIPSFTYLTPLGKRRFLPSSDASPSPSPSPHPSASSPPAYTSTPQASLLSTSNTSTASC